MDTLPDDPLKVIFSKVFWRQMSTFSKQAGEQYFLDLGGNIKKGPTSKSSSCYCGPAFQKFEKKLEKDKQVNDCFVHAPHLFHTRELFFCIFVFLFKFVLLFDHTSTICRSC